MNSAAKERLCRIVAPVWGSKGTRHRTCRPTRPEDTVRRSVLLGQTTLAKD
jgi:hypothetical protein